MWSYSVQFLDDLGHVLKTVFLSAFNERHAQREALRGAVPEDYSGIEVTRLN